MIMKKFMNYFIVNIKLHDDFFVYLSFLNKPEIIIY